jgi:hypothetical protein
MMTATFTSLGRRTWKQVGLAATLALATAASVQGEPRARITPYLEYQQVVTADFNDGDVLTYSGIGGGVDGTIQTRRIQAAFSYNYQRRIAWEGGIDDEDVHSGVAAVRLEAVRDVLSFEAGAMAGRSNADLRDPVASLRTSDDEGVAEIYSAYAGPTLSTHAGPIAIAASYRLGYVHVDDHSLAGTLPAGSPRVERYDSSTIHNATASIGMEPGELPIGWTVGAGWSREEMERLDSTFDGKYVRGDVVLPVSPQLALTAGVGYEDIESSQQDIVRDASGVPVIGPGGELVPDPSRPRLLAYDDSGIFWDAGVIWRPSPRTELQARAGRRYGGTTFTGSLEHRINSAYAFNAMVYDSVDSFGRLLVTDLSGVPRNFDPRRDPLTGVGGGGGCVFGKDPGTGACFDDALQSINNFNFRNRGAEILFSGGRGPWSFGIGAGYNQRKYLAPAASGFVLDGVTDKSFMLSAEAERQLSRSSGYGMNAYAGWYNSGIAGEDSSFNTGITGNYYRSIFTERLQATIAAGLYSSRSEGDDQTIGSVLFGLRYSF